MQSPIGRSNSRRGVRRVLSFEAMESRLVMSASPGAAARRAVAAQIVSPKAVAAKGRLSPSVVQALEAEIDRAVAEDNLPSVAVMISIPGSGRFVAARGEANLTTGRARNLSMPFRIASITKSFTATTVLRLVDRGRIDLNDAIAKWFPSFPRADAITVDDLLRMRSGIPDSLGHELLARYYSNPLIRITPEQSIAEAATKPDQFKPAGRETVYNNLNYIMLQEIVRQVTGRDLGAQIRRLVVRPLGLSNTSYPNGVFLPGRLRGYSLDEATGGLVDKTVLNPGVAGGAGAMISTLRDLTTYTRAVGAGSLLKPATQLARLRGETISGSPEFVKYGQGVELLGPFVGHNGTIFGFSTEAFYLPALRATVVVGVNRLDLDDVSRSTPLFLSLTKIAFPEYVPW